MRWPGCQTILEFLHGHASGGTAICWADLEDLRYPALLQSVAAP
jgi:hypothetical protein